MNLAPHLLFFYYENFSTLGMAMAKLNCAMGYRHEDTKDKDNSESIFSAGTFLPIVLAINTNNNGCYY